LQFTISDWSVLGGGFPLGFGCTAGLSGGGPNPILSYRMTTSFSPREGRWPVGLALVGWLVLAGAATAADYPKIEVIDPPEHGFFTKELSFHGIPIKAPAAVVDAALYRAYDRMALETAGIPAAVSNLVAAGGELHIIGRHQVTTDLPEWRQDKHVPLYEPTYNGRTRDQRTRGMGGLITSCGEENLLELPEDRYRGSDICLHEFAHNIELVGTDKQNRERFNAQYAVSKAKGLWRNTYAGSNEREYFAELTMWYFGSHGSYQGFEGAKPDAGREGLRKYDPEAFALFEAFYSGKMAIPLLPVKRGGERTERVGAVGDNQTPAGRVVGRLNSYQAGKTRLAGLYADAGLPGPAGVGKAGWSVGLIHSSGPGDLPGVVRVRVSFHHATYGDAAIADLEFQDGVLAGLKWDN